ncbi:MAG TPA: cyclic 2,3-diphosphoglycerate synthase [Acidimicrobiia bacterium]|nr:cyclic 2,3-diphosphoglycerate synthase [Acidimicrobiia bacterium]
MRRVVIMGAGGRDFHDFNTVFREDPETRVVAFTATQIPGIADRTYPPALAGPLYPEGIPIVDEARLPELLREEKADEVVFAYSDLSHEEVMHKGSWVMSLGADFRLLGPASTMLESSKPVVAVCATRTGAGKSQTSRRIGALLRDAGLDVSLIRHPMPYGDLERMKVQRFASLADIDASHPTVEEREEYEEPVREGLIMWAGVDYAEILRRAEIESDVIVWDGGNNDFPFIRPDLMITVVDPLRAGHELTYHPGEVNLRIADVVVVNKVDSASPLDVRKVLANIEWVNPDATIVQTKSPVTLEPGPEVAGKRVLVVEDGPTLTHGGMPYGAGTVAARHAGAATIVDPRPYAVGSLIDTLAKYPGLGPVLPAMGYGDTQLDELEATIRAVPCDVVVIGTPIDLGRLIDPGHPTRRAVYRSEDVGDPTLDHVMERFMTDAMIRREQVSAG